MPSAQALARCVPFGLFIAMLVAGSFVSWPWLAPIRSLVVAVALAWFWHRYEELRSPVPAPGNWLLAVLAGVAVFFVWISLDGKWTTFERSAGFDPRSPDGTIDWPLALLRLAGFSLVVPVMEELFWRSFLLRWLQSQDFLSVAPRSVGARAFAITTVLFALEHDQWLAGALAGIVYNALYMRFANLWLPIVAHMITNAALGTWIIATGSWEFW